jgi:hypothetical protein
VGIERSRKQRRIGPYLGELSQVAERPDPHGSVRRARHEAIGVVGESKEQDSAGVPDQVSRESVAYNITYIDVADPGADRHTCTGMSMATVRAQPAGFRHDVHR